MNKDYVKKRSIVELLTSKADNNDFITINYKYIANDVGCSYSYVRKVMKTLIKNGLVRYIDKDSSGKNNIYDLEPLFKLLWENYVNSENYEEDY